MLILNALAHIENANKELVNHWARIKAAAEEDHIARSRLAHVEELAQRQAAELQSLRENVLREILLGWCPETGEDGIIAELESLESQCEESIRPAMKGLGRKMLRLLMGDNSETIGRRGEIIMLTREEYYATPRRYSLADGQDVADDGTPRSYKVIRPGYIRRFSTLLEPLVVLRAMLTQEDAR